MSPEHPIVVEAIGTRRAIPTWNNGHMMQVICFREMEAYSNVCRKAALDAGCDTLDIRFHLHIPKP